jgi:hypothetical protein
MRVEMERRRLDMDKQSTYHAFVKLLDQNVKRSLDMVRLNKKAQGFAGTTTFGAKFGWDDVVCVCKDFASGTQLAEPEEPPKPVQPARAPPPARAAAAAHVGAPQGGRYDGQKGGQERRCDLCSKLGLGGDAHLREWCFIDPKSKVYKPDIR